MGSGGGACWGVELVGLGAGQAVVGERVGRSAMVDVKWGLQLGNAGVLEAAWMAIVAVQVCGGTGVVAGISGGSVGRICDEDAYKWDLTVLVT